MDSSSILLIIIFAVGFFYIALEHKFGINKSWIALFMGATMWMIVAYGETSHHLHDPLKHAFADIFELVFFLMGAMTIVEMLGHFRFFTWVEVNLMKFNISNRMLFWILGLITFFASAILDNLTSTLVMIHIGRYLYIKKENFNIFVINTIIAANAGGAMSPVGDVTTIMLWLAGKFTAWQIVIYGIVPSLVAWIIPQAILTSQIKYEDREGQMTDKVLPTQWGLIIAGFATFGIAVLVNLLHLPPFFGIIFGMGIVAIVIDYRLKKGKLKKKAGDIVNLVKQIDMATIFFFVGILLAVDALKFAGVLDVIATTIFGDNVVNDPKAIITGHTTLGLLSALLDNVPLTAAVIKMLPDGINFIYWILLAVTAGTGGSILIIGSAAGVAAMGQVPTLTFKEYLRKGSMPALLGYIGAVGTWYLMFML